jgi:hypothetical protein
MSKINLAKDIKVGGIDITDTEDKRMEYSSGK